MNETAFADALVDLINSALNDDEVMLMHTATSFADDTMIDNIEQYSPRFAPGNERYLEIRTRRGDLFRVTVERIRVGVPA